MNTRLIVTGMFFLLSTSLMAQPSFGPRRALQPSFRSRTTTVQPFDIGAIEPRMAYRLVPELYRGTGRALATDADARVALRRGASEALESWHFIPLGRDLFRVQSESRGPRWSLAGRASGRVELVPTADVADQLWHFVSAPGDPRAVCLVSGGAFREPHCLSVDVRGQLALLPRTWGPGQLWYLDPLGYSWPPAFQAYEIQNLTVRPNPPLPPAQVELVNERSRELWVLIVDRQLGEARRLKIPAGENLTVSLERDAGGEVVESYEFVAPDGFVSQEVFATPLPPLPRYDVSVYEVIVQSIAIDRTVPGGRLEDVQYAPKSIGWFELPPGPQLKSGPLDVYALAKAQQNPGGVRRLDLEQWQPKADEPDRLEKILEQFRK